MNYINDPSVKVFQQFYDEETHPEKKRILHCLLRLEKFRAVWHRLPIDKQRRVDRLEDEIKRRLYNDGRI